MGKSAKFFKRPTRKEKAVLSLTKSTETSLFDSANSKGGKKDVLSATANPTIAKTSSSVSHPPKASLAYKMQMNGGVKQAIKDLEELNDDWVSDDDENMETTKDTQTASASKKKKGSSIADMDKSKPRPDYVELMYGKQGGGNKRKTFMPKPALIK
ncbi:hypothetical protein BG004_004316 [Podila humilis]|nr:hypothetical protein BG004_004316 [Podila humilis]